MPLHRVPALPSVPNTARGAFPGEETRSASPPVTISLAWRASVISPTAPVMMPASQRISGQRALDNPCHRNASFRHQTARRNVNQVDAQVLQRASKHNRVIVIPASVRPVSCRDADEHGQVGGNQFANALGDAQRQPHPIVEAATEVVSPMVA